MNLVTQLKELIKSESHKLICETHPEVCDLRDVNYARLESIIIERLMANEAAVSIQTALAELEQELSHI